MYEFINTVALFFIGIVLTKTIAVWILHLVKFKSLAKRLTWVERDADSDEGICIAILFLKIIFAVAFIGDYASIQSGEYYATYGTELNASATVFAVFFSLTGAMFLVGAILMWHENLTER